MSALAEALKAAASEQSLEFASGPESDSLSGLNLNRFTGSGVSSGACFSSPDEESAEIDEGNAAIPLQTVLYALENGVYCLLRLHLRRIKFPCDFFYQLLLVHCYPPLFPLSNSFLHGILVGLGSSVKENLPFTQVLTEV